MSIDFTRVDTFLGHANVANGRKGEDRGARQNQVRQGIALDLFDVQKMVVGDCWSIGSWDRDNPDERSINGRGPDNPPSKR